MLITMLIHDGDDIDGKYKINELTDQQLPTIKFQVDTILLLSTGVLRPCVVEDREIYK